MNKNPFQATGQARIRRSRFDLSHSQLMSQNFGELVPLAPIEVYPGDIVSLGLSSFIRAQPLVRPPIGRTKLRTYHFYINYRILWEEWQRYIAGQEDYEPSTPYVPPVLPYFPVDDGNTVLATLGSLWDYFGWPIGAASSDVYEPSLATSYKAMTFPHDAYWKIYNEFFRVPGIQPELVPDWTQSVDPNYAWQYRPAYRNHTRDYFTAALPWTQRGAPPALPVFGSINAEFDLPGASATAAGDILLGAKASGIVGATIGGAGPWDLSGLNDMTVAPGSSRLQDYNDLLTNNNTIDGGGFTSVDINDLRLAWQTQVFLERNARGGARYTETIESHFHIKLNDGRIQRPEFIGGTTSDILFSEIPQTSTSTGSSTPQGYIAGHGVGSDAQQIGRMRIPEHGVIISLVCITVDAVYNQGFPRSFSRRLQLDFAWPEFTGLGEQEIFNYEVFADPADGEDLQPFGYTGRYNELRYLPNLVCGQLRPSQNQNQWTQSRFFSTRPTLSSAFISTAPESASAGAFMRPFAVTNPATTPPFVAHYGRKVDIIRPIPYLAEPSAILGG